MKKNKKILVIDDDQSLCRVISYYLSEEGYEVKSCHDGNTGIEIFKKFEPDLLICDIKLPGQDGFSILDIVLKEKPDCPVIMITAHGTVEDAVKAMKSGSYDYILKPFNKDDLKITVDKAIKMSDLVSENKYLRKELEEKYAFHNIVGKSPEMLKIFRMISQISPADANILILGESGTGKELVANAVHYNSLRKNGPFIKMNCAALPETLLESELFGHEKGSFTGAVTARRGKFEAAHGGTIFLDEIGEMSPVLQSKLLRILQDQTFDRIGGNQSITVDVRVIAATNKNLEEEVKKGNFREDLYYRLNVVFIQIPPLRNRKEDIIPLIEYFLRKYSSEVKSETIGISKAVVDILLNYDWPGNVRELENVIERSVVFSGGKTIVPEHLPVTLRAAGQQRVEN